MDGGLFVCYRRQDSAGFAGRLYDRLEAEFGDDRVFMDVEAIEPGAVFAEVIARQVARCRVLLVMIGPGWLAPDGTGTRRLERPDDYVRLEVESALRHDVWVIPVLIEDTRMPADDDLPTSLKPLAGRHAWSLSSTRFHFDCSRLIETIQRVLGEERATVDDGGRGPFVSHAEVDFGRLVVGSPSPVRTIQVGRGSGPVTATVRADRPWIAVDQAHDLLRLRIDTAVVGRLDGELLISDESGRTAVRVRAEVLPRPVSTERPRPSGTGGRASSEARADGRTGAPPGRPAVLPRPVSTERPRPSGTGGRASSEARADGRTGAPPGRPAPHLLDVPDGGAPDAGHRRRGVLVAAGLVVLLAAGLGLWAVLRGSSDQVDQLDGVAASFPAEFVTWHGHVGSEDLPHLVGYFGPDPAEVDRIRAVLTDRGFSRGYVHAMRSRRTGEMLSLMIIEVRSPDAARQAGGDLSACRGQSGTPTFDVSGVPGAIGRRCVAPRSGSPVQEVSFTRDRRLYRLKLEQLVSRTSTEEIQDLARQQAEVSR
jgi:TIR domain